ncbi:GNAT family N-acetyltransferase [Scatolibacter rhodanostii]|uniref:GNAT family N-acetyltransferase n=1 Tax=Scatolibacter rhodanostii TaxID=2014781 RepID=UPI000C076BA3|nr:GNAT family N-acetyltransferase [Scatolibacter rhodanostii]
MQFRLANREDLPKIQSMYRDIIEHMNNNKIEIWDDSYPCEFFAEDIDNNRLYLLVEEVGDIVAAAALCESNDGETYIKWENTEAKALYMDRLGVNVAYRGQGMGNRILEHLRTLAKQKMAEYIRLFVVDINRPAIQLYLKNGFKQASGIYEEKIDDNFILCEYGFEIRL